MSGHFQTFTCSVNTVASVGCMLQNSRSVNGVNTVSKITIEDCGLTSFKNVANYLLQQCKLNLLVYY
jgi:hypothetical protein